jgi:hypothetical protein
MVDSPAALRTAIALGMLHLGPVFAITVVMIFLGVFAFTSVVTRVL